MIINITPIFFFFIIIYLLYFISYKIFIARKEIFRKNKYKSQKIYLFRKIYKVFHFFFLKF
jgi:hypothetical protein